MKLYFFGHMSEKLEARAEWGKIRQKIGLNVINAINQRKFTIQRIVWKEAERI